MLVFSPLPPRAKLLWPNGDFWGAGNRRSNRCLPSPLLGNQLWMRSLWRRTPNRNDSNSLVRWCFASGGHHHKEGGAYVQETPKPMTFIVFPANRIAACISCHHISAEQPFDEVNKVIDYNWVQMCGCRDEPRSWFHVRQTQWGDSLASHPLTAFQQKPVPHVSRGAKAVFTSTDPEGFFLSLYDLSSRLRTQASSVCVCVLMYSPCVYDAGVCVLIPRALTVRCQ